MSTDANDHIALRISESIVERSTTEALLVHQSERIVLLRRQSLGDGVLPVGITVVLEISKLVTVGLGPAFVCVGSYPIIPQVVNIGQGEGISSSVRSINIAAVFDNKVVRVKVAITIYIFIASTVV